jgi:hypothetical protein
MRASEGGIGFPTLLLLSSIGLSGCELDEVTLAEPQDTPVVEAYIMVGDGPDQAIAFLHWTLGTRPGRDLLDAVVTLRTEGEEELLLSPGLLDDCLSTGILEEVDGVCFSLEGEAEGAFQPGDRVELEVQLEDGGQLRSATEIPGDIQFLRPRTTVNQCALPPGTPLELVWNRSPGVWAYSAETEISNLREALALERIEVEADSVALLGLAVSDSDTTIVFPREFGVFERFDLEQEIALALQEGLPRGAKADVIVAALDQNYVNWIRGGNFNPSGPVRVSSIRGPGIGVLGSVVRRSLFVVGGDPNLFPSLLLPSCLFTPPNP